MAVYYEFVCDNCGFKFETSGPMEFYRDRAGRMKDYGHPRPLSEEAEAAGIYGMYFRFFCLDCKRRADVVLRELKVPLYNPLLLWMEEYEGLEGNSGGYLCPHCRGKRIVFFPENPPPVCPHCSVGRLIVKHECVS